MGHLARMAVAGWLVLQAPLLLATDPATPTESAGGSSTSAVIHPADSANAPGSVSAGQVLLAELAARQAGVTTIKGTFRQHHRQADGTVRERLGEYALARDGGRIRFHLRTQDPAGFEVLRWCSDGERLVLIERPTPEDPATIQELGPGPERDFVQRVVACLLLDLPSMEADFIVQVTAPADHLVLRPRNEGIGVERVEVDLDPGRQPTQLRIDLGQGERITVDLDPAERGLPLGKDWFTP